MARGRPEYRSVGGSAAAKQRPRRKGAKQREGGRERKGERRSAKGSKCVHALWGRKPS